MTTWAPLPCCMLLRTAGKRIYWLRSPVINMKALQPFSICSTLISIGREYLSACRKEMQSIRDSQHWTDSLLSKYPHTIRQNSEVPEAVELYRKILASQPDHTVVIITVGFLTNLSNLLQSGPDKYSPLDGQALVRQKVRDLVSMAGTFPKGKEFNIFKDAGASLHVFTHWPGPVLFSGYEIGKKIKCGLPLIHDETIRNSPVKDAFRICIPLAAEDATG